MSAAGRLEQLGAALEQPGVEVIGAEAWRLKVLRDTIGTLLIRCGSNTCCDLMHLPHRYFSPFTNNAFSLSNFVAWFPIIAAEMAIQGR